MASSSPSQLAPFHPPPPLELVLWLGLQIARKGLLLFLLMARDIDTFPGPAESFFANIKKFIHNKEIWVSNHHDFGKTEQLKMLVNQTRKEIKSLE